MLASLGDFLLANTAEITRQWVVAVDRSLEIASSEDLAYQQLLDHLPQLSTELAEILKNPKAESPRDDATRDSNAHGKKRWQQGYRLEELLREICLIRSTFMGRWIPAFAEQVPEFEGEPRRQAKRIIHRFFDDVIVDSTVQFVHEQQEQMRAIQNELRDRKQAAELADKAKDQFLSIVSHELRTPLTPVLFAASALREDTSLSANARELTEIISRNTEIEARLIEDLIDASRALSEQIQLQLSESDLHSCLQTAVELCEVDWRAKKIDLSLLLEAAIPKGVADAARLRRAFWNLLRTAIIVTHPGGRISVRTRNIVDAFQIAVEQSEIEMDAETLRGMFRRLKPAQPFSSAAGGLGLGPFICTSIVGAHGGSIEVSNALKAPGVILTVTLPLRRSAP